MTDLKPYYSDKSVRIYCGSAFDVLPQLMDEGVVADVALTDPPYMEQTHAGARTSERTKACSKSPKKLVGFASMTAETLSQAFKLAAAVCDRWFVSFVDYHAVPLLEAEPPKGLRFVRFGVWVKHDAAPQFSGDRPGMGWEAVAVMHKAGSAMEWNGGGHHAVWSCPVQRGSKHPTEKPIRLLKEMIRQFTEPGDLILDPFMGSGSVLRAAKDLGRRAIGIEIDPEWCKVAKRRMGQEVLPLGGDENEMRDG